MIHAVLDTSHELLHFSRYIPAPQNLPPIQGDPEDIASFETLLEKHFLCIVLVHGGAGSDSKGSTFWLMAVS